MRQPHCFAGEERKNLPGADDLASSAQAVAVGRVSTVASEGVTTATALVVTQATIWSSSANSVGSGGVAACSTRC